jgi:hypothetical protein
MQGETERDQTMSGEWMERLGSSGVCVAEDRDAMPHLIPKRTPYQKKEEQKISKLGEEEEEQDDRLLKSKQMRRPKNKHNYFLFSLPA